MRKKSQFGLKVEGAIRPVKSRSQVLHVPRPRSHDSKSPIIVRFPQSSFRAYLRRRQRYSIPELSTFSLRREVLVTGEFADKLGFKTLSLSYTCLLCNSAVMPVICCFIPSFSAWCPSSSVKIRSFNYNIQQQTQVGKWHFRKIVTNATAKTALYSSLSNIKIYTYINFLIGLHNH